MSERSEQWRAGEATITSVVESEMGGIPPEFLFPGSSAAEVTEQRWLAPDYASEDGNLRMRVQSFVVEVGSRTILVDPCVGNHKKRMLPFWNDQVYPWLDRLEAAGFERDGIDLVLHTHLHADHVGWDTVLVDGEWLPTFPSARYVYVDLELEHWRADEQRQAEDVYADSIEPVIAAGMADVVDADADLGEGLRFVPTPGHTPGHVSLEFTSAGDPISITGDVFHHPVQLNHPGWAEIADWDADLARATRKDFFDRHAQDRTLLCVAHFPVHPVGRIVADTEERRFDVVHGTPL